jgi:hypothetical protein
VTDDPLQQQVSEGLREAARRLSSAEIPLLDKEKLHRRFIAVSNSAKHDLATAAVRLEALLADLPALRDRD